MTADASPFLDPKAVSEAQFQQVVVAYARSCGWLVHHTRPAQNSKGQWSTPIQGHPGFPDLVLARDGELLLLELKSEKGRLSRAQKPWLEALKQVEAETIHHHDPQNSDYRTVLVDVVRPSDWPALADLLSRHPT